MKEQDAPHELVGAAGGLPGAKLGGDGYVQDGPFTFHLGLYSDHRLQPTGSPISNGAGASSISDLPGVGWRALWFYKGPTIQGTAGDNPTHEFYGTVGSETGVAAIRDFTTLSTGMSGGRLGGGVVLPKNSHAGDRVEIEIKLTTPDGSYGAKLSLKLADGPEGLQPEQINANPL